jgi:hypothetical protein
MMNGAELTSKDWHNKQEKEPPKRSFFGLIELMIGFYST